MRRAQLAVVLLLVPALATGQKKPQQELREVTPPEVDTTIYQRLKYRYIGPEGNRVTSVAGVPGDPNTYYAGAASGGLWKSTDGGIHWEDHRRDLEVAALVRARRARGSGAARAVVSGHGERPLHLVQ